MCAGCVSNETGTLACWLPASSYGGLFSITVFFCSLAYLHQGRLKDRICSLACNFVLSYSLGCLKCFNIGQREGISACHWRRKQEEVASGLKHSGEFRLPLGCLGGSPWDMTPSWWVWVL